MCVCVCVSVSVRVSVYLPVCMTSKGVCRIRSKSDPLLSMRPSRVPRTHWTTCEIMRDNSIAEGPDGLVLSVRTWLHCSVIVICESKFELFDQNSRGSVGALEISREPLELCSNRPLPQIAFVFLSHFTVVKIPFYGC